ncbi:(Fe-S)-binding protein [Coralloluteibacterium stylophorae]|uniref:Glycolate oxidase iron-sulfur subunit n=1 Tax=Coralloluteibacterium stylophorae TaxID=1776034 RepID=A0A8J8B1B0_9GAMM|nr:heterodisulfide reductase-related iron-sulfur binding cluster [Coralloluteibacterium stylophorae]MBS7457849.1 4Fe-4S dicluster domain-containing protein [Coralloluteibacterium stylophorae]
MPVDPLQALAAQCVQCGLCLPHCPTYALERTEAEGPRGRIAYVRGLASGDLAPTVAGDRHLDHCLGCRRCETACPAGVRFGALLLAARSRQRQRRAPPWRQRLLEAMAARPRWLGGLMRLYRRVAPLLPRRARPLPVPPPAPRGTDWPRGGGHAIFLGCVARTYDGEVADALRLLAARAGLALGRPQAQTCCGALHAHAGDDATAARLAATNRAAFAGCGEILTTASGCHEAVAAALGPGRTSDALVFLARHADALRFRPAATRVALHLPCTQHRLAGSVAATRTLLARVPDLEVVDLPQGCCGAAGSAMLLRPERAADLRAPLLHGLAASGATTLLSANIGCRLHLANAADVPVRHPIAFLAEHLQ